MRVDHFEDYSELCAYMLDRAEDGCYSVAVLFFDGAMELLKEFMLYDDIVVESIDLQPEMFNGYAKEYYVSLAEDLHLCVEPAYVGGKYLRTEADLTLVDGNASYSAIRDVDEKKCHEIHVGYSEDDPEHCHMEGDKKVTWTDEHGEADGKFHEVNATYNAEKELNDIFSTAQLTRDKDGNIISIYIDVNKLSDYFNNL